MAIILEKVETPIGLILRSRAEDLWQARLSSILTGTKEVFLKIYSAMQ